MMMIGIVVTVASDQWSTGFVRYLENLEFCWNFGIFLSRPEIP